MASTNSDQENVLLPSDQESPSAPPPAGRLPINALLAAGLCLAAAGLAGAAVMRRQATHAPPKIKHPWADPISLAKMSGAVHFWSEECDNLIEALEKEAKETGRKLFVPQGELPVCKDSEQFCRVKHKMSEALGDHELSSTWCFPATCKQEHILKTIQTRVKTPLMMPDGRFMILSDVHVTCAKNGSELPKERRKPDTYLSQECHDRLEALEKEAEESGRKHETRCQCQGVAKVPGARCQCAEVPVCKVDQSEGLCTVDLTVAQGHLHNRVTLLQHSKCFPAICKQENIQKGFQEEVAIENVIREGEADLELHCVGLQRSPLRSASRSVSQLSCLSFSVLASGSLIFIASI